MNRSGLNGLTIFNGRALYSRCNYYCVYNIHCEQHENIFSQFRIQVRASKPII